MNAPRSHLAMYEKMLLVSESMLSAANEEAWDELVVLEQERSEIVQALQCAGDIVPDTEQEKNRLIGLIKQVQACDECIRPIIVSWMAELKSMFESAGNELRLEKQYGSF